MDTWEIEIEESSGLVRKGWLGTCLGTELVTWAGEKAQQVKVLCHQDLLSEFEL